MAPKDSDGDGIPDAWELAHGLDPEDAKDGNRQHSSGYTMLEVYLNSLVVKQPGPQKSKAFLFP
jgi:hypothetical protein